MPALKSLLVCIGLALVLSSPLSAAPPTIEFAGTSYRLAFRQVGADGSIVNEYVPAGQTIASWTTLIAVRHWPGQSSLRAVVADWLTGVQPLLAQKPESFAASNPGNDYDRIVEAWISAPDRSYLEVNLHRFVKEDRTTGVKAYQFAHKIKMVDGKGDPTPFLKNRSALVAELGKLALPAYKTPGVLNAEIKVLEQEVADLRLRYTDQNPSIRAKLRMIADLKRQLEVETSEPGSSP